MLHLLSAGQGCMVHMACHNFIWQSLMCCGEHALHATHLRIGMCYHITDHQGMVNLRNSNKTCPFYCDVLTDDLCYMQLPLFVKGCEEQSESMGLNRLCPILLFRSWETEADRWLITYYDLTIVFSQLKLLSDLFAASGCSHCLHRVSEAFAPACFDKIHNSNWIWEYFWSLILIASHCVHHMMQDKINSAHWWAQVLGGLTTVKSESIWGAP